MSKIKVDFDILDTGNPYIISLYDISNWGLIKDKVSLVEIISPGEDSPITLPFDKKQVNVYNSNQLHDICLESCEIPENVMLDDGLYQITVKGSPDKFFKKRLYLKTDSFNLELSKLFIKYYADVICKQDDFLLKIQDIQFLIEGSKAAVRFTNMKLANQLWNKAQDKLNELKECCN